MTGHWCMPSATSFAACQFYDIRRVPGNEYGPDNRPWRWPINQTSAGNARHSLYGWEAALHFSVMRRWPGMDNDDDPKLDAESPPPSAGRCFGTT